MRTAPYWTDGVTPPHLDGGEVPEKADLVVIGGGVTGLAAALRVARAGGSVAVVDAGAVGSGASSVSGGMVIYGLKASQRSVIARFGDELADEFWAASLRSIDLVAELVARERIECDFARTGSVELAFTDRDARRLRKEGAWMAHRLGFGTRYVGREELATVIASERFAGALTEDVSAGLHPARYTYGLASAVARAGGRLVEHRTVRGVRRSAEGFDVAVGPSSRGRDGGHGSDRIIRSSEVLVATNGYTGTTVPGLRRRVVPIGSYSVVTEPLDPAVAERLLPGGRMAWTARRLLNYFRITPDGRLLMGGRANLDPDLDLADSGRILGGTIARFFPELAGVPMTHSWGGRLGVTFDLMPHIGRIDGVWYALGYGGHGMGIGTYLGDEVGGILTGEVGRSPFAEIPHPTRWFYRNRPWFLPAAVLLYRGLDRIGR